MNAGQKLSLTPNSISIIIVTYNAATTLLKSLQSIFDQKYPYLKIIIIDGASTDGTVDILRRNSERIFWISEPDNGIYDAMNKALTFVNTDWAYFMGADDELLPGFSDFVAGLTDHKTIYYANVIHKNIKRAGRLSPYYMAKVGIYHQAIIYPSGIFKTISYNTRYTVFADYALNMECFGNKELKFEYRDYIIANYAHTGVSSHAVDKAFKKDKSGLILKNFGIKIWLRYQFRLVKEKWRSRY